MKNEAHKMVSMLALLLLSLADQACGPRQAREPSAPAEAWDSHNLPAILGLSTASYEALLLPTALRGAIASRPWSDSYWPFYKRNVAYRYQDRQATADWASADDQIADARRRPADARLSPAEKYDLLVDAGGGADVDAFALTRESWRTFQRYQDRYPDDADAWSWMGICSGWAPAAVSEPAPRRHVLAITGDGRQIVFLTGDLRGLLSKVYDFNAMSAPARTLGSRCDWPSGRIARDATGRPVDGVIAADGRRFFIVADQSTVTGALEIRFADDATRATHWLLADDKLPRLGGTVSVWRYASRRDVLDDLAADARGRRAVARLSIDLFKACRDANPASLHLALRALLHAESDTPGLIAEVYGEEQVWNQPVVAYRSEIAALRPLSAVDGAIDFRAPGATHIAEVETALIYVPGWAEPRADSVHDDATPIDLDDLAAVSRRFRVATLRYSLEFDAAGRLIGGEWGSSAGPSPVSPDFLWQPRGQPTDIGKDGSPSPIRYSVVKRLLDCSQRDADREVEVDLGEAGLRRVPVASCAL